jgi:integrase
MKAVINNTLIKQIIPKTKPYEIRDERLKGLFIRVQPTGRITYYVEYARGKRYKIGRHPEVTPSIARDKATQVLAMAIQGDDPNALKKQLRQYTLGTFVKNVYRPWAETNLRSYKNTLGRLEKSFSELQNKQLNEINPWVVEKWRSRRIREGKKVTTVNRELTDLKSSLQKAVDWGLIPEHPIKDVKRSRVDNNVTPRYLTQAEDKELMRTLLRREIRIKKQRRSANQFRKDRGYDILPRLHRGYVDHLMPMVVISLNTGLRRGELLNMLWDDVNLEHKRVTVRGSYSKSGKTRHVPLNKTAHKVLTTWKQQANLDYKYVFCDVNGRAFTDVKKGWKALLDKTSITGFRWHDMRHTFASRLVMAGVDLNTVRELLGHSSYQMTLRYAHLAPEYKASAVERLVK